MQWSTALPIVQAPMAGGPSTPALAAAVSSAGGLGFLAAGYLSADQLREDIAATRALTEYPFGVNLLFPSSPGDLDAVRQYASLLAPEVERLGTPLGEPRWDDDAYELKVELLEGAAVYLVTFTFGCPSPETVERLHRAGSLVGVTVVSPAEAARSSEAGVDLLIVQGTEAGGHQGSFLDLAPNRRPLLALIDELRSTTRIPLVGSGGIMSGAAAAEVLQAGALAVQMGTAFVCAEEAGTSATYRRALLERTYADTVVTRAFSGRWARGLNNEFARDHQDEAPEAYPEVHHLTRPLRAAASQAGDPSVPNLWAGQNWRMATSEPAQTITRRIAAELT